MQTFRPRLVWAFLVALAVLVTVLAALPAHAYSPGEPPSPGMVCSPVDPPMPTTPPSEPSVEVVLADFCNVVPEYAGWANAFTCAGDGRYLAHPGDAGHVFALVRNTGHAEVTVTWAAFTVAGVVLPAACFPFRPRSATPPGVPVQVGCMASAPRADLFTSGPTRFEMSVITTGAADAGFWAFPYVRASTSREWQVKLTTPTPRMASRPVTVSSTARVPARVLITNTGTAAGTFRFAAVPGVRLAPAAGTVGPGSHVWVLAYPTSTSKYCRRVQPVLAGRGAAVIGLTFNGARGCPVR